MAVPYDASWRPLSNFPEMGPSLYYVNKRTGWVGGSRKWPVLLTFITEFMLIRWVGGVPRGQEYADVIQGWSRYNSKQRHR